MKYYVDFKNGGINGYAIVRKKRLFFWDKTIAEFSLYAYGAGEALDRARSYCKMINETNT